MKSFPLFLLNKLYQPCRERQGKRLGEGCTALRTVAVTDPTFSTRQGLPESREGGGGGGGGGSIPVPGSVTLGLRHLRTGFYFHISFALHSCKKLESREATGPRCLGSCGGSTVSVPTSAWLGERGWGGTAEAFALWLIHRGIFICSLIYFMKIVQAAERSSSLIGLCSEFTDHDLVASATLQSVSCSWLWCSTAGCWGRDREIKPQCCAFAETVIPHFFCL